MSLQAVQMGNATCQCSCLCHKSIIPVTCYSCTCTFNYSPRKEVEDLRLQVHGIEQSINHIYSGLDKYFEKLAKFEAIFNEILDTNQPVKINKKEVDKSNIFEFIAVDVKRRDDIRHIKESLYILYCWIWENVQDNKWRSKGIECLEEAAMWLNKSISRRKEDGTQAKK